MITRTLFLYAVALVFLCAPGAVAQTQTKASAVEVKDDEFSGKRKVTLTEQAIAPTLKMKLTSTLDSNRPRSAYDADLNFAQIDFISTTGQREYSGSDVEVNFMVDGQRVRGGPVKSSPMTDRFSEDGKEAVVGVLYLTSLDKIARGREVKMKLGENVFTLDKAVIKNIQEFVKALGR